MRRRPPPLSTILVKPAGPDCSLQCTYCFYRCKADLFGGGAHRMDLSTLEALVRKALARGRGPVSFVWQGGEPTLMGLDFFRKAVALQRRFGRGRTVGNALQTNGVALDDAWAGFLAEARFLVGLSWDGPADIHDTYRKDAAGRGTFGDVSRAADLLLAAGVEVNALAVVNDLSVEHPERIYRFFLDRGLAHMQFVPCIEPDPNQPHRPAPFCPAPEAYGRFLCRLFDAWKADFDPEGLPTTSIRRFDALARSFAGEPPPECTLAKVCGSYLVVEHNGDIYPCDFFVESDKKLGNIRRDDPAALLGSAAQRQFGRLKARLPKPCGDCPWLAHCRGGCIRHRGPWGEAEQPNHFCTAYRALFEHAEPTLRRVARAWNAHKARSTAPAPSSSRPPGRNAPCPCGSGKKYKRCCGR